MDSLKDFGNATVSAIKSHPVVTGGIVGALLGTGIGTVLYFFVPAIANLAMTLLGGILAVPAIAVVTIAAFAIAGALMGVLAGTICNFCTDKEVSHDS
jgi:uncharacterized protein (DUF697 family)